MQNRIKSGKVPQLHHTMIHRSVAQTAADHRWYCLFDRSYELTRKPSNGLGSTSTRRWALLSPQQRLFTISPVNWATVKRYALYCALFSLARIPSRAVSCTRPRAAPPHAPHRPLPLPRRPQSAPVTRHLTRCSHHYQPNRASSRDLADVVITAGHRRS
jgi:hypothetical protein